MATNVGVYSNLGGAFGRARGDMPGIMAGGPDSSIIGQLQQLSPDAQNAYAMLHSTADTEGMFGGISHTWNEMPMAAKIILGIMLGGAGAAGAAGGAGAAAGGAEGLAALDAAQFGTAAAPVSIGGAGAGAGSFASLVGPTFSTAPVTSAPAAGSFAELVSPGYSTAATGAATGGAGLTAAELLGAGADGGAPPDLPTERLSPDWMQGTNPAAADSAQFGAPGAEVSVGGAGKTSILSMLSNVLGGGSGGLLSKAATALGLPAEVAGALGPIYNIGSGLYGMFQGYETKKRAQELAAQADPFGPYRAGYAQQLQQLMANPGLVTSLPGYKAGLQAVERRGAAQGWNGSGNMMTALSEYGGNFYDQAIARLSGLAGAGFNPANASQIAMAGNNAGASMAMQGLNRIGYGATQKDPTSDILLRLMQGMVS